MLSTGNSAVLDKVWNGFWPATDLKPLAVLDFVNSLLFLKQLDEIQAEEGRISALSGKPVEDPIYTPDQQDLRWSSFQYLDQESLFEIFYKKDGVFDFLNSVPEYRRLRKFNKEDKPLIPPRFLLEDSVTLINQLSIPDDSTRTEMMNYLVHKSGIGKITPHSETPILSIPPKAVSKPEPIIEEPPKAITKAEPVQEDPPKIQKPPEKTAKPGPIEELQENGTKAEHVPEESQERITKPEPVKKEPPVVQESPKTVTEPQSIEGEPQKSSTKPEHVTEEPQKGPTKPESVIQHKPKRITKRRREIEEALQRKRELEESQLLVARKPAQASNKSKSKKAFLRPILFILLVAVAITLFYFLWEKTPDRTSKTSSRGLGNNAKNNQVIAPAPTEQEATNDSVAKNERVETAKKVAPTQDTLAVKERGIATPSETEQEVAISAIPDAESPTEIGVKGTKGNRSSTNTKGRYKILGKAYFHNEPDENTRRNAFVLHWNNSYATLEALDERNGFIYVVFRNHQNQTSKGWLRKKDLRALE
jgi:hypothetical protein